MNNQQIADHLETLSELVDIDGGNAFRVRAYRDAAQTVRDQPSPLAELLDEGEDITTLTGIGSSLGDKIEELVQTGTTRQMGKLRERIPPGLETLLQVPGLGPRRVAQLHEALDVDGLDDLKAACEQGLVRELEGFGEAMEQQLLDGLETHARMAGRMRRDEAQAQAERLARHLDELDGVRRWEVAGSYRRGRETVGDLDLLIHAADHEVVAEHLVALDDIGEVISQGDRWLRFRLVRGSQVDLRFCGERDFGAALLYLTGAKAHGVALRDRARERGWKLNEYGLYKGTHRLAGRSEEAVYHRLNLDYVPPELREDRGELKAAAEGTLPDLVTLRDIRGDLQAHTDATDGKASLREMAEAAQDRGYEYLAITDHTRRVSVAGGLDDEATRAHAARIRELDAELDDLWLLAGTEVDILSDGHLDLEEATLAELDWVVAALHYDLELDEDRMTDRLLAAIRSGVVHCLAHPTARRLGKREAVAFDAERVYEACAEHGVFLEINAQPDRLDLPDTFCRPAREAGVRFTIGSDAHGTEDLDLMRHGIGVARRGWLTAGDILNTRTATELRQLLSAR